MTQSFNVLIHEQFDDGNRVRIIMMKRSKKLYHETKTVGQSWVRNNINVSLIRSVFLKPVTTSPYFYKNPALLKYAMENGIDTYKPPKGWDSID